MSWHDYHVTPYSGTVSSDFYLLRHLLHRYRRGDFDLEKLKVAGQFFADANRLRKRKSQKIDALCVIVRDLKPPKNNQE